MPANGHPVCPKAVGARHDGRDYVLTLDDGQKLRGDKLLVATGR